MGELRRKYGFWGSLGRLSLRDLVSVEIISGFVLGVGGTLLLDRYSDTEHRIAAAGDYIQLAAALLGVVFAGFALVISLMSDQYIRWLDDTGEGIAGFLRPFMISVGLQVGAILMTVIYRSSAASLPHSVEHWLFGIATTLFVIALFDIVALARAVLLHGVSRAREA